MKRIIALCVLALLAGCNNAPQSAAEQQPATNNANIQTCPETRSQMCTKQYAPVCATRDTGIRCIKAPCPSTEERTYGNGCTACADEKVIGFIPGACPVAEKQD